MPRWRFLEAFPVRKLVAQKPAWGLNLFKKLKKNQRVCACVCPPPPPPLAEAIQKAEGLEALQGPQDGQGLQGFEGFEEIEAFCGDPFQGQKVQKSSKLAQCY